MVRLKSGVGIGVQCVLLWVFAGQAVAADTSPRDWIDRMSHSFRELNYRGAFSYQQGDRMRSFRIAHAVIDGEEYERLEYLDGEQRHVVRKGHKLDCVHAGHKLIRFIVPTGLGKKADEQLLGVEQHYQLHIESRGRLAGRDVVNLLIRPKDPYRYGYLLSLDEQTALPLRSELLGENGAVLERFQFVELEVGVAMDKSEFDAMEKMVSAEHPGSSSPESFPTIAGEWQPGWVPDGFSAVKSSRRPASKDMATYTDGLAVFSVFLERMQGAEKRGDGMVRKGATTAYSRALELASQPYRVTVVGEIPRQTAERIAQSVAVTGP